MNVYVDSNVILDLVAQRVPFYEDALDLFLELARDEELFGYVSVKSLADIHYIYKHITHSKEQANKKIIEITDLLDIADNTKTDLLRTLFNNGNDFEDDLIIQLANRMNLDYIVTRNQKHFENSSVKAISPRECLELITEHWIVINDCFWCANLIKLLNYKNLSIV